MSHYRRERLMIVAIIAMVAVILLRFYVMFSR